MSTLHTIDLDAGTPDLVETTVEEFEEDGLNDELLKVYVYIGGEGDAGWKAALSASGALGNLKPYLASDREILSRWNPEDDAKGVVYGTGTEWVECLNAAQARNRTRVRNANANAN